MMRSIAVAFFLLTPAGAYAGQASAVLRVGITITGPNTASTVAEKSDRKSGTTRLSVSPVVKTEPRPGIVRRNAAPLVQ